MYGTSTFINIIFHRRLHALNIMKLISTIFSLGSSPEFSVLSVPVSQPLRLDSNSNDFSSNPPAGEHMVPGLHWYDVFRHVRERARHHHCIEKNDFNLIFVLHFFRFLTTCEDGAQNPW